MALNTTPIFAKVPQVASVKLTAANTNYDGSGTLTTLYAAPADHVKITWIKCKVQGASSAANKVAIWITDTTGNNPYLFDEILLAHQASPSASVKTSETITTYADLELKAGQIVKVTEFVADNVGVFAQVGDLGS